jgi:hypothetical protein
MPDSITAGLQLAFAYDPIIALSAAALAAALLARSPGVLRILVAAAIVAGGWWLGGGSADAESLLALYRSDLPILIAASFGVVGSILFGYAVPVWAGVFVGRRVTWGTGWLSAAAVAAMLSRAVFAFGAALG